MLKSTLVLGIFIVGITIVTSHKILFIMAFATKSHRNAFDPVMTELVNRGHQVTFLTSVKATKEIKGVTEIPLASNRIYIENSNMSFFIGPVGEDDEFFSFFVEMFKKLCHLTYADPEVDKMIKNPSAHHYDVVVVDGIFNEFALALGHHLGSPNIIFSPGIRIASLAWGMNIPQPISYIPNGLDSSTDMMTFWQRMNNLFAQVGFHLVRHNRMFPSYDKIISQFIPNLPTIAELENKVSFFIGNTHPALAPPMPNMPYSIEVGCVNCKPANPLPKELEDFMQSSGDSGVIYFSLGSLAKGDSMPIEMRTKIMEAFAQLPQKVLWKYESDIGNLPKNIKLMKWAPQQDLLEHEKMRLFITHGGGLSTSEAVYHGCPVLGFPLSADQWGNMAIAVQRGFAEYLDFRTFTIEELLEKINRMLKEDRYQKAADHYSAILKDYQQPPVERAAYWIEYVARHKGAPHLKSAAENLNFFQYFLLDIIGAFLLTTLTALTIMCLVIRKLWRMFCKEKSISSKKKTN